MRDSPSRSVGTEMEGLGGGGGGGTSVTAVYLLFVLIRSVVVELSGFVRSLRVPSTEWLCVNC